MEKLNNVIITQKTNIHTQQQNTFELNRMKIDILKNELEIGSYPTNIRVRVNTIFERTPI